MEAGFDLSNYIAAFKRRWWLVILPAILLTPLAAMIAYVMPPVYTATARILIESQQIPTELARSTVTSGVAERIALIEQRLMTRQNLLDIADRFKIYAARPDMTPTDVVDAMREATQIVGVRFSNERGAPLTGVNISFSASQAGVAAQVANEFLSLLLEQNIRQRNTRAIETSAFFNQEVARLSQELSALDAEITRFKIENEDALPSSLGFRRSELARLEAQIFERELAMTTIKDRRDQIIAARAAGELGGLALSGGERSPEQAELDRLRGALAQQSALYAETHPSIRSLRSRIEALETMVAQSLSEEGESGELSARTQIDRQIEEMDVQFDLMQERMTQEQAQIERLENTIERTPEVELQLGTLQRRHDSLQSQLAQAQLRQAEAERGERLEVNNQAERFEVIEQAQRPTQPDSPNRPLIVAAGFAGGLALGGGLVVLLELLNRSLRSPADLRRQLDMLPLVTIPYIATQREILVRRWALRSIVAMTVVVLPLALVAIDQLVTPLALLGRRAVDVTGLDVLMTLIEQRFGA